MPVSVSVIIPVYRDWQRLSLCLEALDRQTLPAGEFEIIIANNEPAGHCPLPSLPANARLIHQPAPGSYAARNKAVAASRGEYLAFTDSDCVPEPEWLEHGLRALRARPGVRLAGPVRLFRETGTSRFAHLLELHTAFRQADYVKHGHCATANLIVERRIFDRVGDFDEVLSGGDTRWNQRASGLGIPIIFDETVAVLHPARRSLRGFFRKRRRVAGSRALWPDLPALPYVIGRLFPPIRLARRLRGAVGPAELLSIFFLIWAVQLTEAKEFLLVRLGLRAPRRS